MRHTLAFLSSDARLIERLQAALGEDCAVLPVDPRQPDGEGAIRRLDAAAIVIDAGAPAGARSVLERIADLKTGFPGIALIAIGDEMSAQLILAAFRAGADDFIDRDASDAEIRAGILARLGRAQGAGGKAALIGVLSPAPCDEDADLALNIASIIADADRGRRTLLLDLSLPVSPARTALGLEFRFTVGAAIRDVARLDRTFLDSACARAPETGLYVLPLAGDDNDAAPPQPRDLGVLVPMLRALFDTVVIHWGAFSRQATADADAHLFVCCNQRFASIRNAKAFLAQAAREGQAVPVLAIHQFNAHIVPTAEDIQQAVGAAQALVLRTSWSRLANAHNQGRPLALASTCAYGDALRLHLAEQGLLPQVHADHPALKLLHWLRR